MLHLQQLWVQLNESLAFDSQQNECRAVSVDCSGSRSWLIKVSLHFYKNHMKISFRKTFCPKQHLWGRTAHLQHSIVWFWSIYRKICLHFLSLFLNWSRKSFLLERKQTQNCKHTQTIRELIHSVDSWGDLWPLHRSKLPWQKIQTQFIPVTDCQVTLYLTALRYIFILGRGHREPPK